MSSLLLPLTDPAACNPAVTGGKAASLATLTAAALPIPPGFVVATAAYEGFLAAHRLDEAIAGALAGVDAGDPRAAEAASAAIRDRFRQHAVPSALAGEIAAALAALGPGAVAVRSSATAEDLPGFSFAGQQESFLDITGIDAVLRAVVDCWSSLWTARAIAYRAHRWGDAGTGRLAMAVLVQAMVPAEFAGVAFTAHPVSGARDEAVVEAVPGRGDALVSGRVAPHRFVVDLRDRVTRESGREVDGHVARDVARLGRRVAAIVGEPQDIEWAWTRGAVWLLQSRPITSLYPIPAGGRDGLRCYVSFGAIQGMLDPMTPLGRDTIRGIFSGAANLFGFDVTWKTQRAVVEAGERLWIDVTPILRHPIGRRLMAGVLSAMEPRMGALVREAAPRVGRSRAAIHPRTALRVPRVMGPMALRAVLAMIFPEWSRRRGERYLERLVRGGKDGPAPAMLAAVWRDAFPTMIPHVAPRVVASVICQRAIGRLARGLPDGDAAALLVSRGLPYNPTADMNRALWDIARELRRDPAARARIQEASAASLAVDLAAGRLPAAIAGPMHAFIERYGARGVAEIDLGRPRWREDPAPLFQALQAYVGTDAVPPEADARSAGREAEERVARWRRALRERRGGRLRGWLLGFFFRRYRALAGLREGPKFAVMRRLGPVRWRLQQDAAGLVRAGVLERADDVFFLHADEIAAAAGRGAGWRALVRDRRRAYERERDRKQVPLVLLSDGRVLHAASSPASPSGLGGTPVSPGVAEGIARVLHDPASGDLRRGEILVCRGTDPAWTPLFLTAAGLVTEVGGVMSHGAVVAREYGIPAVVGVADATILLSGGQRIRVDGTSGAVAIHED